MFRSAEDMIAVLPGGTVCGSATRVARGFEMNPVEATLHEAEASLFSKKDYNFGHGERACSYSLSKYRVGMK